jgi:hypothetical protein
VLTTNHHKKNSAKILDELVKAMCGLVEQYEVPGSADTRSFCALMDCFLL